MYYYLLKNQNRNAHNLENLEYLFIYFRPARRDSIFVPGRDGFVPERNGFVPGTKHGLLDYLFFHKHFKKLIIDYLLFLLIILPVSKLLRVLQVYVANRSI